MSAVAEDNISTIHKDTSSVVDFIKAYTEITKPERTLTNVMTAAAGFLLASAWSFSVSLLLEILLGTTLVIASACVFNNLLDRRIDKVMARTNRRVLVTGVVPASAAIAMIVVLGLVGFGLLSMINWLTFWLGAVAFISYVFIYGYSKRKTIWSTLIGTLPGGLSLVAGYTAFTDKLDFTALLLFLVMLTWQMAHFYAIAAYRRDDYKAAKLPVWSVRKGLASTKRQIIIFEFSFAAVSILLALVVHSWLVLAAAIIMSAYWLRSSSFDHKNWARRSFSASLSTLLVLCITLSIASLA